jgi:hypothetical protein
MVRKITRSASYIHAVILLALITLHIVARQLSSGEGFSSGEGEDYFLPERHSPLGYLIISGIFWGPLLTVIITMWFIMAIPMTLALVAAGVLTVLEFFVRKLAEYPKGPILALNGVFVALGGFLKAFL